MGSAGTNRQGPAAASAVPQRDRLSLHRLDDLADRTQTRRSKCMMPARSRWCRRRARSGRHPSRWSGRTRVDGPGAGSPFPAGSTAWRRLLGRPLARPGAVRPRSFLAGHGGHGHAGSPSAQDRDRHCARSGTSPRCSRVRDPEGAGPTYPRRRSGPLRFPGPRRDGREENPRSPRRLGPPQDRAEPSPMADILRQSLL